MAEKDDTVYGGGYLVTAGGVYCTAGFSVRSSASAHGLMTAGHCENALTYNGRKVLNYINVLPVAQGDVQWHNSSETADPRFYYAPGSLRTITATANATPGMSLCKYGQTTDNACGTVYKTGQCRSSYCGLVMMNSRKADGGDSGGPWFWGNTGYGIHSGGKQYLVLWRDMFTPVRSAATNLGLTVKLY